MVLLADVLAQLRAERAPGVDAPQCLALALVDTPELVRNVSRAIRMDALKGIKVAEPEETQLTAVPWTTLVRLAGAFGVRFLTFLGTDRPREAQTIGNASDQAVAVLLLTSGATKKPSLHVFAPPHNDPGRCRYTPDNVVAILKVFLSERPFLPSFEHGDNPVSLTVSLT